MGCMKVTNECFIIRNELSIVEKNTLNDFIPHGKTFWS